MQETLCQITSFAYADEIIVPLFIVVSVRQCHLEILTKIYSKLAFS